MSLYNDNLKLINLTEKRLYQANRRALQETRALITEIYEKYAEKGVLSYSEMVKYNRLVAVNKRIEETIKQLWKTQGKTITDTASFSLGANYRRLQSEFVDIIYKKYNVDLKQFSWSVLKPETVSQYVQSDLSGRTLKKIITDNQYNAVSKMQATITNGIVRGLSIDDISANIRKNFDLLDYEARRIARTETLRQYSNARELALTELESDGVVVKKFWKTNIDDKTRDDHLEMDNQQADKDGNFDVFGVPAKEPRLTGVPSQDINCRCDVVTELVIDGKEFKPATRSEMQADREFFQQQWEDDVKKQEKKYNIPKGVL